MTGPVEELLRFADEFDVPASDAVATAEPWQVLVVDDEPDVLAVTRTALHGSSFLGRSIRILGAASAGQARDLLIRHPGIAVVLLDVVMETDDAGLRLVEAIRNELGRQAVRIILRTGQPGRAPEREVITRYDINDYRLKTDLTAQSLFTSVVAGLRGYSEITLRLRAEEAAILANRSKTAFLANINHELRTPLNAIIGLAELMENEVFGPLGNESYRGFARDIVISGKALNETLGAILDVANIEFADLVLRPESLDVEALLRRVAAPMTSQAARAGVSVSIQVEPEVPLLWGDGRRLRQVLLNLISNAIRFNRSGGLVTIAAELVADGRIALIVRDTGIGMTEAELAVALTPFGQVESGPSRRRSGTGLGLPLARMIVNLHGGVLNITSVPGQGTVVQVILPAVRPVPER